jgi:hypothetical protein
MDVLDVEMELVVEISFIRDILIDIYPNVCIFICLLGLYGDTFFQKGKLY